ncbi:MAG: hypothetical protein LBN43_07925 [Oscillospiraceae bacterium]|jgi:hypothetical protein|nr:hypothetical protein [Oscillospiraceae bacterium]
MDEQQFMEHIRRISQERQRIGASIRRIIVTELPESGDTNTIYMILQDESAPCSDPLTRDVYKMWHFYPEGDWSDWGNIEVRKDDDDIDSAFQYADESFDDAINDIL